MILRLVLLLLTLETIAQNPDSTLSIDPILDTISTTTSSIVQEKEIVKTWSTIRLSSYHLNFLGTNRSIQRQTVSFSSSMSEKWKYSLSADLNRADNVQNIYPNGFIMYAKNREGIGFRLGASDGKLAPLLVTRLNYFRFLNDHFVLNASTGRIALENGIDLYPYNLGLTYVHNQFGYSISFGQDASRFLSTPPQLKLGITHETSKGDIYNIYFFSGVINSPEFQFQFERTAQKQMGFGGWFKKNLTNQIALSASLGYQSIDGEFQKTKMLGYNLALIIKF